MDPKFDIKQIFTVLYRYYLPYRPSFMYRFKIDTAIKPNIDQTDQYIH